MDLEFPVFGLIASGIGVVVGTMRRLPMRGWVAGALLIVAALPLALMYLLIPPGHSSPSNLPVFLAFMFAAPLAVTYSIRARRTAPDRLAAWTAFVASFFIGAVFALMVAAMIYELVCVLFLK